jgi:importin subunit alpha-1
VPQAVWALGNIAGDSPECRDLVLAQGVLIPLLEQLNPNSKMSMLRNATWTLSNLCRGKPQPAWNMVLPALPVLAQLVFSNDDEVLADGCWALSYLSDGPNEKIQAVLDTGICARVVELMGRGPASVQTPALRTAGNVVTGDDQQTQCVINCGALPRLLALLNSPKKGIRKEACWTISNITAGTREQIQAVIEANIIPPLVHLLATAEFDIKKEAAWSISNATSGGSPEQIKYLVQQGCIKPLCDLLTCNDPRLVTVALEGIENVLKSGEYEAPQNGGTNPYTAFVDEAEGLTKLEMLQTHNNEDVYKKAVHILETYFGLDDDDDTQLVPDISAGGQGFVFQGGGPAAPPPGGFTFG